MTKQITDEVVINHIQEEDVDEVEEGEIAVDIYRTDHSIFIVAPISGVTKEDVSVRVNDNVLVISGQRKSPVFQQGEYVVKESFWGKFNRMIVLPSKVDIAHMKAEFKNGILIITVPVIFEPKEKVIRIDD